MFRAGLLALLLAAAAVGRWRPEWLLPLLVASLPVAQWAPWTGWNAVSEFDLLVLAGAGGGLAGVGLARAPAPPPLPLSWRLAAGAFLALSVLACWRGLADAGGPVLAFQTQYTDATAALVAFKPLALVVLLWPLLRRQVHCDVARCLRSLAWGMCAGVAAVAAGVVWERLAMVGLADFSRPYRAVGLFWEMHVGGAAIDAYVAMAMPFVVWAVWAARRPLPWLVAAGLAVATGYACLTTFSRGVYAAVLLPLPGLAWLLWRRRHPGPSFMRSAAAAALATGGAAGLVVAGYALAGRWGAALAGLAALSGLGAWARRASTPWAWRPWATRALAAVLVLEVVAVVGFGNFLVERMQKADRDLGDRWDHWTQGVKLLHDPMDRLGGIGLGRLPSHLSRFAPGYELSGSVALEQDAQHAAVVRLAGPPSRRTLAGQFALGQRVALVPGLFHRIELDFDVRERTDLGLSVCETHLLYERRCQLRWVHLAPGATTWQHLSVELRGPQLGKGLAWAPRLAVFQATVLDEARNMRLANMALSAPDGKSLLRNGDFAQGLDHWLPLASAYFHPWHIDNLYLELAIERGPLAMLVAVTLCLVACVRLGRLVVSGDAPVEAAFLLAALGGAALVGLMSSVLDTGRPAFLLTLLAALALAMAGRAPAAFLRPAA